MDENNDGITDSTDVRFEFEVRQEAMQLQRIQAEMNALMVQARLYSGATSSADQARAIQIERTLQSLRDEQALVENHHQNITSFGTGFPDASTVSAASGGLFSGTPIPLGASSSSSAPPGASSGVGLFMSTPASTPAGSVGTITGATPGNAAAYTPGSFGAAHGIDWNWRPSWLQTARPAQPIAGIDFATDLNWRQPRVMPSDSTTDPVEEVD